MYKIKFKFIGLMLALSLITATGLPANQVAFAEDAVLAQEEVSSEYLALKGMGFIEDDFEATQLNNGMTRAHFMGILYNMAGLSKATYNTLDMPFIDVNENTPYKKDTKKLRTPTSPEHGEYGFSVYCIARSISSMVSANTRIALNRASVCVRSTPAIFSSSMG